METVCSAMKRPRGVLRTAAVIAALLFTQIGAVGTASTASAATSHCPVGYACIWDDTGFTSFGFAGEAHVSFYMCQYDFAWRAYRGVAISGTINANDSASSVSNRGNYDRAYFYMNRAYSGSAPYFSLLPNSGDGDLVNSTGNAPGGFNNSLSSGRFTSASDSCM